jgi:hypothetical protein
MKKKLMKQALGIFMKALNPFMSVDTIFIVLALYKNVQRSDFKMSGVTNYTNVLHDHMSK